MKKTWLPRLLGTLLLGQTLFAADNALAQADCRDDILCGSGSGSSSRASSSGSSSNTSRGGNAAAAQLLLQGVTDALRQSGERQDQERVRQEKLEQQRQAARVELPDAGKLINDIQMHCAGSIITMLDRLAVMRGVSPHEAAGLYQGAHDRMMEKLVQGSRGSVQAELTKARANATGQPQVVMDLAICLTERRLAQLDGKVMLEQ